MPLSCPLHTPRLCRRALAAAVLGLAAMHAQAVLITFDDLPPPEDPDQFAGTSVTNEYAGLGLLVNEGYLAGSGVPGTNQALYGAPYLSLSFIGGTLPTYVSLYVSAPNRDKVSVDARGPGGWGDTVETDGFSWPPGSETPYRPNQYVSFHSETGISNLDLTAFYFLRTGPVIDNLYFGNAAPVPEPASLVLALAGGLSLWAVKRLRTRPSRRAAGCASTEAVH